MHPKNGKELKHKRQNLSICNGYILFTENSIIREILPYLYVLSYIQVKSHSPSHILDSSPVNAAVTLKSRPMSIMTTGKGTVLQKAKVNVTESHTQVSAAASPLTLLF